MYSAEEHMITTAKEVIILVLAALIGFVVAWSVNDAYQKYIIVEEINNEEDEARKELVRTMVGLVERREELARLVE